jgi:hypothetical protein
MLYHFFRMGRTPGTLNGGNQHHTDAGRSPSMLNRIVTILGRLRQELAA